MRNSLAPCPFCGGSATVYDGAAHCLNRACAAAVIFDGASAKDFALRYNRRHRAQCLNVADEHNRDGDYAKHYQFWCSECGCHNSYYDFRYCPECGREVR